MTSYTYTSAGTYTYKPQLLGPLGCYRYHLKEPLEFKIEITKEGTYIAYVDEPIAEYGTGKTESEALDDLCQSIIDYYESLLRYKIQLGKACKKELKWLKKNIEVKWFDH